MSHESPSWDDLPQDLVAGWNPGEDEGPLSLSSGDSDRATRQGLPSRLRRPWSEAEEDSIPKGSTALCRAFVLKPPEDVADDPARQAESSASGAEAAPGSTPGASSSGEGSDPGARQARRLPGVGEEIKGFRLRLELGRGAFARVFLAEEINLGNRLVALKISRAEGEEPQILARLQHPHVVPVHSVHDDPITGLRLLCMPFLGGANLARLLQEAWGLAPDQATGQSLVEALDHLSQRLPPAIGQEASLAPGRSRRLRPGSISGLADTAENDSAFPAGPAFPGGRYASMRLGSLLSRLVKRRERSLAVVEEVDRGQPSRRFLRGANGIEASVWIVAHLAQGLEHAHDRGLLHRDLKPANVLVAADGTPMLLDFNLAAELEEAQDGERIVRAMLGGTLPYMSPEHLDAFDPEGSTAPEQVDERSDLYALGLILFEMISGEHPFPEPPDGTAPVRAIRWMREERRRRPVPSLRARCPDVPWSLDALVAQCLDPDPGGRYQSARDLAEDLGRFLENKPMRHCPEPSLRERAAKWARRHPMACSNTSIIAASLVLLVLLTLAAAAAYDGMLGLAARLQLRALDREFTDVQFLLNTAGRREETLKQGILRARAIVQREGIPDPFARPQSSAILPSGASARWIERLTPAEQAAVNRDLVELLMLEARASVVLAEARGSDDERRRTLQRAIARLDQAEQLDAPIPAVLFLERANYHERLGQHGEAAADRGRAAAVHSTSSRDLTLLGTSLLESDDLAGAEAALRLAIARDETSLWAWFAMGHCHFDQGRFADAVADFSAAVACGPRHAWTHFNRGLALAHAGRPIDAKLAYDRALELDPEFVEARVNRGLAELQLDRVEEARADLQAAVDAGRREVGILAALGEALARLGRVAEAESRFRSLLDRAPGDPVILVARAMTRLERDPAGAEADFKAVLEKAPHNTTANYGMARLIRRRDPAAALALLEKALEADPENADAFQLRALERARAGDRGALDDVERLLRSPTAEHLYNAACALALYGAKAGDPAQLDRAVSVLSQALRVGFPATTAESDPDLKALAGRPDFRRLIDRHRAP